MGILIKNIGSYLPEKILDNKYFESILDTSDEWITKRTGIKTRHFTEISVSQMAIEAVNKIICQVDRSKVKLIICASFSDRDIMPNVSSKIANHFNILGDVRAFDINLACSGYVAATDMAEHFLEVGQQAIIIGSEDISSYLDLKDRATAILFGDGAAATLIEKTPTPSVTSFGLEEDFDFLKIQSNKIFMEGNEVFKFAVGALKNSLSHIIEQGVEFDYIVCHQANIRILNHVSKALKISDEKFYSNISKVGNTSAASIPICLDDMRKKGIFRERKKLIISGFGAGLTYYTKYVEVECHDEF